MGLHIDFLAAGPIRHMSQPAVTKRKSRTFLECRDKERGGSSVKMLTFRYVLRR